MYYARICSFSIKYFLFIYKPPKTSLSIISQTKSPKEFFFSPEIISYSVTNKKPNVIHKTITMDTHVEE